MAQTKTLLVVDDEPNNLAVLKINLQDNYRLLFAKDGKRALALARAQLPDLILSDIMMPEMDGYEMCKHLKEDPATRNIPIIFITAMSESEDESRGLALGAVDYITKPIRGAIVQARVKTHLSLVRADRLAESQRAAIRMLGEAGHYNDSDTGEHIWRMANYAATLAAGMGWDADACDQLDLAASMHDTGKIGIPDQILKAPRKLSDEEFEVMKQHTVIGHSILSRSKTPIFQLAAEIALYHHECWDGSGYPTGLKGEDIPQSARIVAVADVFDALTMKRSYKKSWTVEEAAQLILDGSGKKFDPDVVNHFTRLLPELERIKDEWSQRETQELDPGTVNGPSSA